MKSNNQIAKDIFKEFSGKEGNQHIAQEYALKSMLDIIEKFNIRSILEIGLGIGTIPYMVFSTVNIGKIKDIQYCGIENNKFCLAALKDNLGKYYKELNLCNSIDGVGADKKYDLVIVDGSDDALESIKDLVNKDSIIIIEGYRQSQVDLIKKLFNRNFIFYDDVSLIKNPDYGPFSKANWQGGIRVFFLSPNTRKKLHYTIKRISTSLKYRVLRKLVTIFTKN